MAYVFIEENDYTPSRSGAKSTDGRRNYRLVVSITTRLMSLLQIQFYTWESRGDEQRNWWRYFEQQVPHLKDLGMTHVWLPPMSKSATKDVNLYPSFI